MLATIESSSAAAALRAYAAEEGLDGETRSKRSGQATLAVLGVGLLHARSVATCQCGTRKPSDVYFNAEQVCRCRECMQPVTDAPVMLSPQQYQAAASLCVAARGLAAEAMGSAPSTVAALLRLGVIEARACGGLDPLYHLTQFGREIVCVHHEDGDSDSDGDGRPFSGDPAGPLPKEVTMTAVKSDPKPSARKQRRAAKPKTTVVPPVEDVTNAPLADATSIVDVLVGRVLDMTGRDGSLEKKKAYSRVKLGKTVVYVNNPTKKGVRISVPADDGYHLANVTSESELDLVMPLIEKRIEVLREKAAAKSAA